MSTHKISQKFRSHIPTFSIKIFNFRLLLNNTVRNRVLLNTLFGQSVGFKKNPGCCSIIKGTNTPTGCLVSTPGYNSEVTYKKTCASLLSSINLNCTEVQNPHYTLLNCYPTRHECMHMFND